MEAIFKDIMAIIAVVINGLPQLIMAASLGFALKPAGFAFIIGGVGNAVTGSLTPISAQAETITIAGLTKDRTKRASAMVLAAIIMILMGSFGLIQSLADFAGPAVVAGMMAGVGYILTDVAIQMTKKQKKVGLISIAVAVLIWIWKKDTVWVIFTSVVISSLYYSLVERRQLKEENIDSFASSQFKSEKGGLAGLAEELKKSWTGFTLTSVAVWLAAFNLVTVNIGANTTFGNITASMSGGTQNLNVLSFINSLADIPSAFFGGPPIEAIISGTGAAPHPVVAGVITMIVLGVLCLTGAVEKIGKYVPAASIAGFLLIIGFVLTFIPNATGIIATGTFAVGFTALGATIISKNPFLGMVAGIVVTYAGPLLGL